MSVKKNCKFLLILFGLLSLILSFQCSQFSAYATQSKKQNFSTNYTLTGCSLPSKTQKSDTQNAKNRSDLSDLRKPERFFLCNIIF